VKLTDVVARLGGDEFVVYLPDIDSEAAAGVASRMIDAVGQHYSINGNSLTRSCSIGVAVWEPGDDVSAILRKADRAAYRAKHEGRSRFIVY
jgi:diguanylate cyclase (GGDEF)-like protein